LTAEMIPWSRGWRIDNELGGKKNMENLKTGKRKQLKINELNSKERKIQFLPAL
jgi:hypothetical protein